MPCDVTYHDLAQYEAGELDSERATEMEAHLGQCEECRCRLTNLKEIDAALEAVPQLEPPASVVLATRRLLSREVRGVRPEVMTLDEVAAFLRVGIDDLAEVAEDLPAFEIAGMIRVRRDKLVEWIEQRERTYRRSGIESEVARVVSGRW
jgi:hypothetical protein